MLLNSFLYLFICWLLLAIIDRFQPSATTQKALALVALIGFVILLLLGFVVPHRITVSENRNLTRIHFAGNAADALDAWRSYVKAARCG